MSCLIKIGAGRAQNVSKPLPGVEPGDRRKNLPDTCRAAMVIVALAGFEPTTSRLMSPHKDRALLPLSYNTTVKARLSALLPVGLY